MALPRHGPPPPLTPNRGTQPGATLRRAGLPVKALKADRDKISRALTAAARLEDGNVYRPKDAAWLGDWEAELLTFPNGRHDDQADVFAYAALQATRQPTHDFAALAAGIDSPDLIGKAWPI